MTVQGKKFPYTGREATRPIPIVVDESDRREIARMALTTRPSKRATSEAFGPKVKAPTVFGKKVAGAKTPTGGTFNPSDAGSLLGSD